MAKEDLSWMKKPSTKYSKEEVRLLASNPKGAQEFIDSTKNYGGATMSLATGSMIRPGDKAYIVGKEPSQKTGKPVQIGRAHV